MNPTISEHDEQPLRYGKYVLGFALSVTITLMAYLLVTSSGANKNVLVGMLAVLAVTQFIVQMVFFLHIGEERRPRWKLAVMFLMLSVVSIIVIGSIWIMNNLNYRMMNDPQAEERYLKSQDSL